MTRKKYCLRQIAPAVPAAQSLNGGKVWLLNLDQIEPHTGTLLGQDLVARSEVGNSTHAFDAGNVLYSKLRPYLNKVYIPSANGFCTSELVPMRPNLSLVTREYLAAYLRSPSFLMWVNQQIDGAKMPRVSMKVFWDHEVELPPIEEQQRVTSILDQADSLRRKRQETIRLEDDFLRAMFNDMFGDPVRGEKKWPTVLVGDLVRTVEPGWSAPSTDSSLKDGGLGVLKVSAVSTGWFLREEAKAVERSIVDRQLVMPRRGDLLFSRANTRELVAACCLVEEDVHDRFLPDKLWRIGARNETATNEYLCFLFRHPSFRHELTKQATGTSGSMLNISQAKLLQTSAPCPPVEMQKLFSSIVHKAYLVRKKAAASLAAIASLSSGLANQFLG